jgi:hypothetical protein
VRLSAAVSVALALVLASTAGAADGRGLVVGVGDDWVKWRADTAGIVRVQREAGFDTVRIGFPWHPGMWHPGKVERHYIERIAKMASLRQRVVVAFAGAADDAPRTRATRLQFCSYVRSVLSRLPAVRDVVIWNEVNSPAFWRAATRRTRRVRRAARPLLGHVAPHAFGRERDQFDGAAAPAAPVPARAR